MKIISSGSVPLFSNGTGIGTDFTAQMPPQISRFDVYYIYAPVVGIQILGDVPSGSDPSLGGE